MSYERDLSIFAELEAEVKLKRDRLAFRIDTRVVQETPVDTSQARSNWIVSQNRSIDMAIGNIGPSAAISNGAVAIRGSKAFCELFISNNMPYIERLNEGWSQQAPTKYIDRIIEQEVAKSE